MKKIIVGSKNPVKVNSVLLGFQRMFPGEEFQIEGVSIGSGVSDQPMSDKETLDGAYNRANNARDQFPQADFRAGIEGGIQKLGKDMECFAWIAIRSDVTNWGLGKARTAGFFLPPEVVKLIDQGKELGEADDIVFGQKNSKQKSGAVGILTGDVIDRTKYYEDAVVLSLIPFKNQELFQGY